jgi:nucleoside-triphosphatase THEP1
VSEARVGLLTGAVGVGKTTIAERVVGLARRQKLVCGGILAPAMHNSCGQKIGIWGVDILSAERRILARTDRDLGGPTIGPYSFAAEAMDWAISVIKHALNPETLPSCDLLIVDEIGKLELWQGVGLAPTLEHLASGHAKLSLVLVRASLLAELQSKLAPVEQIVFEVDKNNRREAPGRILKELL